ncbi:ABC transporter substrate-binding protein [Lutibacter sp. HS1-25]|uniref:ABC transporter substrate-binding protein n=1 Tax=Lutibacter sp. HS1-25 TaxID=2485000 RepID=UPI001011FB16|nr:ABC transporter substrate-binding protein [Lutibacter sp. HS1-25]RXP44814.1 ABC transporter substrate-binding protein [Lutibacter sp. HS1-25]
MKLKNHQTVLLFIASIFLISCKNEPKNTEQAIEKANNSTIKYAKGFDIQNFENYTKLTIRTPYQNSTETFEYLLSNENIESDLITIKTPIEKVVVTSTTHVPMLELLNIENKLVGYPNTPFVSSVKTRRLIDEGKVQELGNEENINTELLLDLNPDLVIGFSVNSNSKMFAIVEKIGVPIVLNGDWLEKTPLGRAEWIKFFGVLFNKEKEADSVFKVIEKNYLEAKKIALNAKEIPTVLAGGLYKDIWNMPAGDSFEATFLKDANTNYLWKDSKGTGSLALNIENVFEKGKDADIWISPGFYATLEDLEKDNLVCAQTKAFKNKTIYSYNNTTGETGGIWYFELSPIRPDLVLKDLIKITHPELLPDYEFTFYKKLN